jgi:hypothetical protein
MIEGAILLHEHDDVFNVAKGADGGLLLGQHAPYIWRHESGGCGRGCQPACALQELAAG